ncbi:FAD binding domain-containing protein [Frigidibacter sp. MR17.24]|uniref:FAD binding domain-containing protein n=1 Tax=Frigidibacter sp. MR17.24 TaxID=3127345 RepID=UPI003012F584
MPFASPQDFARPDCLEAALALRAQAGWRPLAGGTDLFAATRAQRLAGPVLDLTAVDELRGLSPLPDGGLRIGAATPWAEIARAPLPPGLSMLAAAARQVGGRQVQSRGTIGGNLCNASPAADGVPPLLAAGAIVELASARARRRMPLATFLQGPRRTLLGADELMVAIEIPARGLEGGSAFLKLGARAHLVISIVMVAARITCRGDRITDAAVAVGACSGTALRLTALEAALAGRHPAEGFDPALVTAALSPLDDIRATADYRRTAAAELVARALRAAAQGVPPEIAA